MAAKKDNKNTGPVGGKSGTRLPEDAPVKVSKPKKVSEEDLRVDAAVASIEKEFGKGAIMDMGSRNACVMAETFGSGSIMLDKALGVGGYPKGRIIEIYGREAAGKTTLALHAIAEAQKTGGKALFIDAEHALDPTYAKNLGVDMKRLLLSQPDYGEQALAIADKMIRSAGLSVVVIDSVAALVPRAEIEGEMGDAHMGLQARMMSQAMRKLAGVVSNSKTSVIFINQIREKIGVVYGSKETTSGGNALKFYASIRIDIRRIGQLKQGDKQIGSRTKVKVIKNKLAPPFQEAEFDIIWGKGVDHVRELLEVAVDLGCIKKAGAHYSFEEEKLGNGKDNTYESLKADKKRMKRIEAAIKIAIISGGSDGATEE